MTLRDFLASAAHEMETAFSIPRFMHLRYEVLADNWPHATFSVNEATPGFFARALHHLTCDKATLAEEFAVKRENLPEAPYMLAYKAWIRQHRQS